MRSSAPEPLASGEPLPPLGWIRWRRVLLVGALGALLLGSVSLRLPIPPERTAEVLGLIAEKCGGERVPALFLGGPPEAGSMAAKQRVVVLVAEAIDVVPRLRSERFVVVRGEDALRQMGVNVDGDDGIVNLEYLERRPDMLVIQAGYVFGGLGGHGLTFTVQRSWLGFWVKCVPSWVA